MTDETNEAGQGDVLLHEAEDADIDAYLASSSEDSEGGSSPESDDSAETPTPTPQSEPTQPQPAARETDSGEPRQPQESREAQLADLKRRLADQERFIKQRNLELGNLRQQLLAKKEEAERQLDEKFLENPRLAVEDMRRLEDFDREVANTHMEEQALERMHHSQALIAQHFKPDEVGLEDMVQCVIDDGIPAQYVEHFKANPWTATEPHTLLQIAKRARAESTLRRTVPLLKHLLEENQKLRKSQGSVIKNVEKAFRQPPPMTAANGGSHPSKRGVALNPEDMGYEQLVEFLENN